MTYSTHTIHLEPTDTLSFDRDAFGTIGVTVSDYTGRTVTRVEVLGRPDQLDPVELTAVEVAGPVICGRCGMPATADLCAAVAL